MQTKNEKTGSPFGGLFDGVEVIRQYTRSQMVADGFLVEVPADLARQAGFAVPVGVLIEAWEDAVAWSEEDSDRQTPQDQAGRLWDLLNVLRVRAKAIGGDTVFFTLSRIPRDGRAVLPEDLRLKAVIGPGDDPRPVITVMHVDQD